MAEVEIESSASTPKTDHSEDPIERVISGLSRSAGILRSATRKLLTLGEKEWINFIEGNSIDPSKTLIAIRQTRLSIEELLAFTTRHIKGNRVFDPVEAPKLLPKEFSSFYSIFLGGLRITHSAVDSLVHQYPGNALAGMQSHGKEFARIVGRFEYLNDKLAELISKIPEDIEILLQTRKKPSTVHVKKSEADKMYKRLSAEWDELTIYERAKLIHWLVVYENQRSRKLDRNGAIDYVEISSKLSHAQIFFYLKALELPPKAQELVNSPTILEPVFKLIIRAWETYPTRRFNQFIRRLKQSGEQGTLPREIIPIDSINDDPEEILWCAQNNDGTK